MVLVLSYDLSLSFLPLFNCHSPLNPFFLLLSLLSSPSSTQPQKKSRHKQEVEKREAEKALTKLETELMDPGLRPQTAASFERLLLSSPDSSLLWLQFMAFHLQATQIEQARAVAERALKTISFRLVVGWGQVCVCVHNTLLRSTSGGISYAGAVVAL